ncbi:RHS repeat domain-containing protein [Snodgrassella alvi]|uniref:RHS repeat domain-containing protein n=1 Tax=Snodgrassella alvi TaxID=1196083 RepID=UPI00352E6FD9
MLLDEAGHIVWACSYQLWGKPIQEIEHSQIQQNLRYQGQYLDRETGLHYNTFRYYDPDIGRFTQPDPIGLLGGFNLYQYAPNGLMWIDPAGLAGDKLIDGIPQNPGIVRRFMSKAEFKKFTHNGFTSNPIDCRGGISVTSAKIDPKNPDAIKKLWSIRSRLLF